MEVCQGTAHFVFYFEDNVDQTATVSMSEAAQVINSSRSMAAGWKEEYPYNDKKFQVLILCFTTRIHLVGDIMKTINQHSSCQDLGGLQNFLRVPSRIYLLGREE